MIKENNRFYIVKKDDNLEKIAQKYNISPIKVLILNNLTPEMIKEGQVLFID